MRSAPRDWLGDVEHEALLILARKLRRTPDLHIDPIRAEGHFAPWLRTIISRDCLEAIRKLNRHHRPALEIQDSDWLAEDRQVREIRVDVSVMLERLPALERTILSLYAKGYTMAEVSTELRISPSKAHRTLRRGFKLAQDILESHRDGR